MNIMNIPAAPTNAAEDQEALEKMRSTLGAPIKAPQRRSTTSRRERRDVRNTMYNPMADENSRPLSQFGMLGAGAGAAGGLSPIATQGLGASSPSSIQASPISAPPGQSLFAATPGGTSALDERTQSMLSSASAARAAAVDPFATAANLSASGISTAITETVNVLFSGKELTKIMVVGEIAISLKDVTSTDPVHIRIDSFEQLEKAAPNPAFLTSMYGRPGEYKLDLGALLAQAGGDGAGVQGTILKYQLHVSEDPVKRRQFLPLDLVAQWRCEDQQTSLLINYSANTESRVASSDANVSLQNLTFIVGITPGNVTSVMSKPNGAWSPESKKIQWAIAEDLPLTSSTPQKILARFQVDAKSIPQSVGARWTIPGQTLSQLGISVVQESSEAPSKFTIAETARRSVAGKYLAGP